MNRPKIRWIGHGPPHSVLTTQEATEIGRLVIGALVCIALLWLLS